MPEIEPIEPEPLIPDRDPYNSKFCKFIDCVHRHGNKCEVEECIYNMKRIIFWEKFGVWKGE
jgi:putative ribosome biogenesis GTPase RsgA